MSLVNLLTLKKYLFNIHYLRMSCLQTRLKDSILLSNHQRFTQTFPLSWTTSSFDCPNKSPLFHLDEYYPTYSIDPDGTITASYPLNNSTIFEVISKDNYCIDHDSLVLFCVPEQGDVCPELVSSPWGIFHVHFNQLIHLTLGLHTCFVPNMHDSIRLVLPPDPGVLHTTGRSSNTH